MRVSPHATRLSAHSLKRVPLTSEADRERYSDVVRDVQDLPVQVIAAEVDEDDSYPPTPG